MLQSHTATQQWQSFELRMRRRRVERCLLRASVALEAGVLDDAREAIEEARRLNPHDPELQQLTAQLAEAENPVPIQEPADVLIAPDRRAIGAGRFAAAVVFAGAAGFAGWWGLASIRDARAVSPTAAIAAEPAQSAAPIAAPDPSVRVMETAVTVPTVQAPAAFTEATVATTGSAATADRATPVPERRPAVDDAPPPRASEFAGSRSPLTLPDDRAETLTDQRRAALPPSAPGEIALPAASLPGTRINPVAPPRASVSDAPAVAPAVSTTPKIDPLPSLPAAPETTPRADPGIEGIAASDAAARAAGAAASARSDEQSIRAVLNRYEAAYSRLDSAAAARVWPGVNQRALANAFQGLSAQTVSLGRCDVRVNGATARAECAGTASWTPKVGGGAQSAARQWRFDLRNAGGEWLIAQATMR